MINITESIRSALVRGEYACGIFVDLQKSFDIPTKIIHYGNLIPNPTEVSNYFNNYYSEIADNILRTRKFNGDGYFKNFLPSPPLPNSLAFTTVSKDEVISTISCCIKTNKSCGPCSIPPNILLIIKYLVADPLDKIINISILTGSHPEMLKLAKIVPIFKTG